ncbi:MAG: trypsin-like peptidase domain-containing protein [Myxococcales bacterium]|nr:trypsin-like peptidase domain-containing protein [Myxococcales bacterium]
MTRFTRIRRSLVAGACAVGLAAGVGLVARSADPRAAQATPLAGGSTEIADVAERVVDSVVNVSTTQRAAAGPYAADPFWNDPSSPFFGGDDPRKAQSLGSGVIVSPDGRILTNAHVVDNAAAIRVTLRDGTEFAAKVIGADPRSDVAVLQLIPGKGAKLPALRPLPMGDSSTLRLGEVVLAVGNPFGVGQAVTMGIVSAVGRASVGIEQYEDFIQTDAAINPGNSGGALVDMKGHLVGINTAILSRTGGYQGIGFAIPTNMARPIMDMLIKDGRVSRGYLGVQLAPLDQDARAVRHQGRERRGRAVGRPRHPGREGGPGGRGPRDGDRRPAGARGRSAAQPDRHPRRRQDRQARRRARRRRPRGGGDARRAAGRARGPGGAGAVAAATAGADGPRPRARRVELAARGDHHPPRRARRAAPVEQRRPAGPGPALT